MLRVLYYCYFLTIFACSLGVNAAEFSECINEPMGGLIPIANNCSKAIHCTGIDSAIVECNKDSPYFSSEDKLCHNSTSVCGDRPFSLINILTTTPFSIPTAVTNIAILSSDLPAKANKTTTTRKTSISTVATTTGLLIWNTTSNVNILSTTAKPLQAVLTVSKASAPPLFVTTSTSIIEPVECPAVDDNSKVLFLADPSSCSQYFLCYHGVAMLMKCPNNLHFDVIQQTCNTPTGTKCNQINLIILRNKCQHHIVALYPHPSNCNYYYFCKYGFLMVMQCPFDMYWDYEQKACTSKSNAKCYNA